jgi:hypothetical protein
VEPIQMRVETLDMRGVPDGVPGPILQCQMFGFERLVLLEQGFVLGIHLLVPAFSALNHVRHRATLGKARSQYKVN